MISIVTRSNGFDEVLRCPRVGYGWKLSVAAIVLSGITQMVFAASSIDGHVRADVRYFLDTSGHRLQSNQISTVLTIEPSWRYESVDRQQLFRMSLSGRVGNIDSQQDAANVKELLFSKFSDDWELHAGIGEYFWGVTESQHVVDIINQLDLVQNIDGEEKVGQAVVNLTKFTDVGTLDFFLLPGFQERRYPGMKGRLRTQLPVDAALTRFESAAGRHRLDLAARFFGTFGASELGVSVFSGTSRAPQLSPAVNEAGTAVLAPYYPVIAQWGIDAQYTRNDALWKWEAIRRTVGGSAYYAVTGGIEYGIYGIFETDTDLSVLFEPSFDSRALAAGPFDRDVFVGLRLSFNDAQSTEIVGGLLADTDRSSRMVNLEASRRLGADWTMKLQARLFRNIAADDPLAAYRADSFVSWRLSRFF